MLVPVSRRRRHARAAAIAAVATLAGVQPLSAAARDTEWIFVPFPIYAPETCWALTVSAIGSTRFGAAPASSLVASAAWSEREQRSLSLDPRIYLEEGWLLQGRLAAADWPTDYFGLGADTRQADEETYESRNLEADLNLQRRTGARFWIGPRLAARHYRLQEVVRGGLLDRTRPPGFDGGLVAGAGLVTSYDSRDDVFAPEQGLYLNLGITAYGSAFGSDYRFREWVLDTRQFVPLRPGWVLALHQHARLTRGDVPFQELSLLANTAPPARLRGYLTGRFRDRDGLTLQSELRFPIWRRISAVAFLATGDVAPRLTELSPSDFKWTGGAGLRYRVSATERINLRLDVAVSEEDTAVYFALTEAF
ncbi:BamA/TamA family outer membrane protein [Ectothiorhodospiraceae bacterium 2226]|nr:BamA/TamA family outer membrane protein [Ectothiorhodospiraceae bacterium 2226]